MTYDHAAELAKARAYLAPAPPRYAMGGSFYSDAPLRFSERPSPDVVLARWRARAVERDRVAEDALTNRYAAGEQVLADSLAVQVARVRAYLA